MNAYDADTILEKLTMQQTQEALRKYGVRVAYLFGSYAKKAALPTSDIDIAVLFGEEIDRSQYLELSALLTAELMKILKRNDVDVVVLNTAFPLLRYKVFADGEIIFSESEKDRVRFEVKAMRDYFDTKPLRNILRKAYVDRSA
jgi:predicted nucleotidyltransferase